MKPILTSALIVTILLSACTKQEQIRTNSENEKEYLFEINQCKSLTTSGKKDACLLHYVNGLFYNTTDVFSTEPYEAICPLIEGEVRKANCYWFYALDSKDISICKNLPEEFENSTSDTKYNERIEMTFGNCENMLQYQYGDSQWFLKAETEFYSRYEGKAEIEGWAVEESFYDQPAKFFQISEKDLKKLPIFIQNKADDYFLVKLVKKDGNGKYNYLTEQEMETLEKYDENNPFKIKINAIVIQSESPVSLYLADDL